MGFGPVCQLVAPHRCLCVAGVPVGGGAVQIV